MPQLPIIIERQPVGALELPRRGPSSAERGFRALGAFGEALQAAQEQQDNIDVKRHAAELDSDLEVLKEEVKSEPDFAKRETIYREKAAERFNNRLSGIESPNVQKGLSDYFSISQPRRTSEFTRENQTEWGSARVAQTDDLAELAAAKIARTNDPQEAAKWRQLAIGQYQTLGQGPFAPLSPDQAQDKIKAFESRVQLGAAMQAARIDPVGTIENLSERFPLLDARQMETVLNRAATHEARLMREEEKEQKRIKDTGVLEAAIAASNNNLSLDELQQMARQFAFNDEDFTKLRNEIERGGASDPEVVSDYEVRIREGRGVGFREIVGHSEINKSDKQRLLGLIDQQRDEKHFSKLPEYQQAVREVRIAVSRKGPFETLDPQEQKLLLFSTKQLYDRVEKGEDPINVAREIAARIPEEQGGAIGLPDLLPKYPNEEALTRALKEGRVSKQEAAQEALLFKRMREKQRAGEELKKKAQGEREKR